MGSVSQKLVLFCSFFFSSQIQASAQKTSKKLLLKAALQRYSSLGSWQASFTELQESPHPSQKERYSEGRFYFSPPNLFRWELIRPIKKRVISNGRNIWEIFPAKKGRKTLVRRYKNFWESQSTIYLLLTGGLSNWIHHEGQNWEYQAFYEKTNFRLRFDAPDGQSTSSIEVLFKGQSPAPDRYIVRDTLGNKNTLRLITWEKKKALDLDLFSPEISKDFKVESL